MLERIVLLKLKPAFSNLTARGEVIESCRSHLASVRGLASVTAGVPADPDSERAWDVLLRLGFSEPDAQDRYLREIEAGSLAALLNPKVEIMKAWTFELGAGAKDP